MSKQMLIDASHLEETRVIILNNKNLEEFECETSTKKPIKGNIYLARVVRVEPSLQAAFVDFGSNRHGFLAFNEIHPDYYRVPVEDQAKLLKSLSEDSKADGEDPEDGDFEEPQRSSFKLKAARSYKIQEVIKKRQVILVQVVKDERGGKGAALTSYLSLPGRYCVLMPNTPRGGGISRKITDVKDRKRLKEVMGSFEVMEGAGLILRTAGMGRTKLEIKRDYDYLMRLWEEIREKTVNSQAPDLIYEEGNLITKAIRDFYTKEIDEVLVEGEESYKEAKNLMRILMPSHAKKVRLYKDNRVPLFHRYDVEGKIDSIHLPVVHLPSGGYVVINPTEALVSIDVNSGKATRERHIEETALKTNLEAAEEVARQLRLRDLAGLIVIDFIDMDNSKNNGLVERAFREALKADRARIQVGSISIFGLLEMSRQRLKPSLEETISMPCSQCRGTGVVRSVESSSLQVLRALEAEGIDGRFAEIIVYLPTTVAFYLLNQKRSNLVALEKKYDLNIVVVRDDALIPPDFRVEHVRSSERERFVGDSEPQQEDVDPQDQEELDEVDETAAEAEEQEAERPAPSRGRRQRRRRFDRHKNRPTSQIESTGDQQTEAVAAPEEPAKDASVNLPEKTRGRHLKVVPKVSSSEEKSSEEKPDSGKTDSGREGVSPSSTAPSEEGKPSRGARFPRKRGGVDKRNRPSSPSADTLGEAPASPAVATTGGDKGNLNKRGATRLKVGPGAARHFGRRYAKEKRETIKRTGGEIPPIVVSTEPPSGQVRLGQDTSMEKSTAPLSPKPKIPARRRKPAPQIKTGAPGKAPTKKIEKESGGFSKEEKSSSEAPTKKGWWKRLLES